MIYFDNAATSFPKPKCVASEVNKCIKKYCGNPGRSSHYLSQMAAEQIYSAREAVADLLGIDRPESVVFTYNATYALNLAIKSHITNDCHVITSDFEHNSVIRPLEKARKSLGISYSIFKNCENPYQAITQLITPKTTGIICSMMSNVTGETVNLGMLSDIAKKYGLFLIIDGSQSAGHTDINLTETPCDVFCAPGHKGLFGIQGCGFAVFNSNKRGDGIVEGGSGNDSRNTEMPLELPEGYEAGTLSTPSIASLLVGIKFIKSIGIENIECRLNHLTNELYDRLLSLKGTIIYGRNSGIISFNYKNVPSYVISGHLNDCGICTRSGLHCAPSVHSKIGTLDQGAVRLSLSYLNKMSELDKFYKSIKSIVNLY